MTPMNGLAMTETEILKLFCGGDFVVRGSEIQWDFGYKPKSRRGVDLSVNEFPADAFMANEDVPEITGPKVFLWDYLRAANSGVLPPLNWQRTGSCFPAGVPVRMADGSEKPVEQVRVGDLVRSHSGASRHVTDVMSRKYSGEMTTVTVKGMPFPVSATADHPFAVWRDGRMQWVDAESLEVGDDLIVSGLVESRSGEVLDISAAIPEPEYTRQDKAVARFADAGVDARERVGSKGSRLANHVFRRVSVTASLARLVGLYLAEGGCHEGRAVFTFNRKELHYAEEVVSLIRGIFGVESRVELPESRPSVCQVRATNVNLTSVLKWMVPGDVYSKRVPAFIMRAPKSIREACLKGWLDGDGSVKKKGWFGITGVSASSDMVRDMMAVAVSCGLTANIQQRPARGRSRQSYQLYLTGQKAAALVGAVAECRDLAGRRCPLGKLARVKKLTHEQVSDVQVYDFTVEEDHSFVANGLIVHNCVNGGMQNALILRQGVEVCCLPEPEEFRIPFTLGAYAESRRMMGDSNEGEGSRGGLMAKAFENFGTTGLDDPEVPQPKYSPVAFWYDAKTEYHWSSIRNVPAGFRERAKAHRGTYGEVRTSDEALKELRRGRPLTIAGDWGGKMRCGLAGGKKGPKVLWNGDHVDSWGHQQAVFGAWEHEDLGLIFYVQNQWFMSANGVIVSVHGTSSLNGEPEGGYWTPAKTIDYQGRVGEIRSLKSYAGFVPEKLSLLAV